jgi:hypothetical protein
VISDTLKQVIAEAGMVIPEVFTPVPHNGAMEERVKKLEDGQQELKTQLVRIDTRLDHIEGSMATKTDLAEYKSEMIKWIVGTAIAMGVAAITVMTFVLNNATPKAPAAPQQPIVIYAPAAAVAPQTAPAPAAKP